MLADARVLLHLARGLPPGASHAERMQNFYAGQADHYDEFRERLLQGRSELMQMLAPPAGAHIVELGCGTGRNLEFLGTRLDQLARADIVDLCPPLLERARLRWAGQDNVHVVEADACHWRPDGLVDVVYFSYALTMIPNWQVALVNAVSMLRPGGQLGVVDFTVPSARTLIARCFWRAWFGHDGVRLDARHVSLLQRLLPHHSLDFFRAPLPYLPWMKAHCYQFVGTRN